MTETIVQVQVGEALFAFESERHWFNMATQFYAKSGVATCDTVAIDAKGRVCSRGKHYMRATAEGTYPITVYAIDDDPAPR